jgi:hypothetical protein
MNGQAPVYWEPHAILGAILEMLFDVTNPYRESKDRTGVYLDSVFAVVNKGERRGSSYRTC